MTPPLILLDKTPTWDRCAELAKIALVISRHHSFHEMFRDNRACAVSRSGMAARIAEARRKERCRLRNVSLLYVSTFKLSLLPLLSLFLPSSSTSWPSERDASDDSPGLCRPSLPRARYSRARNDNDLFIQHRYFSLPHSHLISSARDPAKTSIR